MPSKKLIQFLVIEILILFAVIISFMNLDKKIAGLIGGALFVSLGLYLLANIKKWDKPLTYLSLYTALMHLFIATLPILVIRLTHWSVPFRHIDLGLITGPGLHKIAEYIYLILMLSHLIDFLRLKINHNKSPNEYSAS